MALSQILIDTISENETLVLSLDNIEITEAAKKIAFYHAMVEAAKDDPIDDPEDQAETLAYLQMALNEITETYMILVNDAL
jgi:hypothetical protein